MQEEVKHSSSEVLLLELAEEQLAFNHRFEELFVMKYVELS